MCGGNVPSETKRAAGMGGAGDAGEASDAEEEEAGEAEVGVRLP